MAKHSWVLCLGPMDGEAGSFGVAGWSGSIVLSAVVAEEVVVSLAGGAGGEDEEGMKVAEGGVDSCVDCRCFRS